MSNENVCPALQKAIQQAGGSVALSALMGGKPSRQAIEQWKRCPPTRALELERLTGVSRHELRPDLYPVE